MTGIVGLAVAWAGDPKEIRSAYDASDTERWLRLSTEATLAARAAKTEQEVLEQLELAVAAADGRTEGFEGVLLSAVTEAWERGASSTDLRDLLAPLAHATPAAAEAGEPAFVPVGSTSGYGARFVRLGAARSALGDLLLDPTGSLSAHFGESLCDLDPGALEAQLGPAAAAQVRAMCEGGGHQSAAGDLLGGATLGLLSDFDCLLGPSATPSFDQQLAQAALDCLQEDASGVGNPLASGDDWVVRETETTNADGSRSYHIEIDDGSWSTRTEWPDGSFRQLAYHSSNQGTSVFDVTPTGEFRLTRVTGGTVTVKESSGYSEECVRCPEASGGKLEPSGDAAACTDLVDQVYEHFGRVVPGVDDPRPDHVSFPSPDALPEADADRCLDSLGAFEPAAVSAACGLQYCPLGEAPDPNESCVCRPLPSELNFDDLSTEDCAHQLNCVEGTATSVAGVCVCPEPGQPEEPPERWPGVDGDSSWRW